MSKDIFFCWIAPYPVDCNQSWDTPNVEDRNCIRGDNASIYRFGFYLCWVWLSVLVAFVATYLLYDTVKQQEDRTLRYRRPELTTQSFSIGLDKNSKDNDSVDNNENIVLHHSDDDDVDDNNAVDDSEKKEQAVATTTTTTEASKGVEIVAAIVDDEEEEEAEAAVKKSSTSKRSSSQFLTSSSLHMGGRRRSSQQSGGGTRTHPLSNQVLQQAMWYLGAFVLTHVFGLITQFIFFASGDLIIGVLYLHLLFDPGQGLFNFVVYRRPTYIKLRTQGCTRFQALYRALRWSFLPPLPLPSVMSSTTTTPAAATPPRHRSSKQQATASNNTTNSRKTSAPATASSSTSKKTDSLNSIGEGTASSVVPTSSSETAVPSTSVATTSSPQTQD